MRTSIFRIELAMDGKMDFVRATNPFGSGEPKSKSPVTEIGEVDRKAVAQKIARAFGVDFDAD